MNKYWQEDNSGLTFCGMPDGSCQQERLEMLYYEGIAEEKEGGYFLSYENVALLSEPDAELLSLPERNPYQISITADGVIGHNDLHYMFSVLKPGGDSFVNPVIRGCILHIDEEREYRLDINQYNLVRIANESNQNVPNMDKRELPSYTLVNLARIQRHAKETAARLDEVLSTDNQRVIVPEKLDVEFIDDGHGNFQVAPVIIEEGTGSLLPDTDEKDFQALFGKGAAVKSVYSSRNNGKNVKYVCQPEIKNGLEKVKAVNKKSLTPKEKERYSKQPRELFEDDIFTFRSSTSKSEQAEEQKLQDVLPDEGEFVPADYSDRIIGLTSIKKSVYYGSGHKTDWLGQEGTSEDDMQPEPAEQEISCNQETEEPCSIESASKDNNSSDYGTMDYSNQMSSEAQPPNSLSAPKKEKTPPMALDIKPNFDIADYSRILTPREGSLNIGALKEGISLYDYQNEAVTWMYDAWSKGFSGVLLADDMGLGKTLQTLAFLSELKYGTGEGISKPVLIVGPTALLKNWENEYHRFVNEGIFSEIISLHGFSIRKYQTGEDAPNGKKKLELKLPNDIIALTTYETLRDYQFSFAEVQWGAIIVDEAQKIKNPTTGVTTAIKAMNYDYAICLSGTPVENSWTDIWSIMDFVQPKHLGSLQEFRENYVNRLRELDGNVKGIEELGKQLKIRLNPLFMRRMKTDKLEGIPQKDVHVCLEVMPPYQKRRYLSILKAAQNGTIHPLATIAKLRDVSLHPDIGIKSPPSFYDMKPEDVINQSARLITTFKVLHDVNKNGEKALIFVISKKMQLVLRHLVKEIFGIYVHPPINGEMNGTARQKIIDKFNQSDGFGVLILSPEAAGVGFTITSANHVIHLSRTWNPAKEDQATDRVYRIGQKKNVHVYLPLACTGEHGKSFDENLNELLEYKRRLSDNVLFPSCDDIRDGEKIFNKCMGKTPDTNNLGDNVTVEEIDTVIGTVFEQIIADLYKRMDSTLSAKTTPKTNDNGADVVVIFEDGKRGLLLQCKHKDDPSSPTGKKAVQEIFASQNYYKNLDDYRGIDFQTAVITNAVDYTPGAKKLADADNVHLIARNELKRMLSDNPLPNIY